ncbi:MAG TPA: MauE/DoxX family redox-associated membrane protein [Chloroflexia bacterium]|jgi:hypothetical protein
MTFAYYLSLGYVATTLLIGGMGHLLGFAHFRSLVRSHGIVPTRLATPASILVTVLETVAGGAFVLVLLNSEFAPVALPLFALSTVAGAAFVLYIRLLLRRPAGITSCGCSPFAGPLTPASIVPASALLLMSVLGLVVTGLGFGRSLDAGYELLGFAAALPLAWGMTLTTAVFMLPAFSAGLRQTEGSNNV